MASQLTEKTLGGSLQNIAKLESTVGWIKFNREMRDYLTMNGFGDLLGRNKDMPNKGTLTEEAYETKQDTWLDKQERACAVVRSRLGTMPERKLKKKPTLRKCSLNCRRGSGLLAVLYFNS